MNCTDVEPQLWVQKSFLCHEQRSKLKFKCNRATNSDQIWWLHGNYCQKSCYDSGYGYEGDDCSVGWPALAQSGFQGYVCDVREGVGGWVALGTDDGCDQSVIVAMQNPAIWLNHPSQSTETTLQFKTLKPGVLLLDESSSSCDLAGIIKSNGLYYWFDSRLELLENTLESPVAATSTDSCPTVPKSFLNAASCKVQPACTSLGQQGAPFTLNRTNLEYMSSP
jgi:hypothetical protein